MNTDVYEEQEVAQTVWTSFSGNSEYIVAVQCTYFTARKRSWICVFLIW